jgi:hypothetical protein
MELSNSPPQNDVSLNLLPNEILDMIFSILAQDGHVWIIICQYVCKEWYNIITNSNFPIRISSNSNFQNIMCDYANLCTFLRDNKYYDLNFHFEITKHAYKQYDIPSHFRDRVICNYFSNNDCYGYYNNITQGYDYNTDHSNEDYAHITFFKVVYRRFTNFAFEPVTLLPYQQIDYNTTSGYSNIQTYQTYQTSETSNNLKQIEAKTIPVINAHTIQLNKSVIYEQNKKYFNLPKHQKKYCKNNFSNYRIFYKK